jgi:drug/metabolite transporter (DMT)-like permease
VTTSSGAFSIPNSLTNQRQGIAFAIATSLLFACSDALIKQLVVLTPFLLVLWLRYLFQFSLMATWLLVKRGTLPQASHWQLHLLRCILLTISSFSGYLALRNVPLAEYTALMMLAPVVSVVLGRMVLKEQVSALQWGCVLLGAIGMLAVLRPGFSAWTAEALLPVASACAYAAFQMTSRKLMAVSDIVISNLISAAFIVVVAGLALILWPLNWSEVWLKLDTLWWLNVSLMCLIATFGQLSLAAALQKSSLSVAAPFAYLQILFAAIIGLVFFDHWPDRTTLLGTTLIAIGGIGSALLNGRSPAPLRLSSH